MDDLTSDAPPTWSPTAVADLLADATVVARDERAAPVPLPAGLADLLPSTTPAWNDQLAQVHPEDRAPTVRAWWGALARPGHLVEARARYREDGRWAWRRVLVLDVRHQPDLGVVLVGIIPLGDADEPAGTAGWSPTTEGVASWASPAWIVQHLDGIGTVLATEGRVEELFGRPPEALTGTNILDSLHPDDHEAALAMWVEVLSDAGQTRTIRQRVGRPDGTWVWIESTVTNRLAGEGGGAVVAVSHDITQRLAEEAELRASREELRMLAEEVPVAVFRADPDGRITFGNARWYGVLGEIGPVEELVALAHPGDADRLAATLAEALHPASAGHGAIEVRAADGRRRFSLTWRRADADGRPEALLGVLTDVTDTVALRHRAEHDDLTGLLNRRGLEDRLAGLLADGAAAVAFVDLDGFKALNDAHGHLAGDAVLAEVGARLGALGDVVAGRWGGDEFVLVVAADGRHDLEALAGDVGRQVEQVLADPVQVGAVTWVPEASVGVAAGRPGDAPADLLRRADAGMYAVKRRRR